MNSCEHLDKVDDALNNYHVVLAYYVTCIADGALKTKAKDLFCRMCKSASRRLHACLECAFFGCFNHKNGQKSHMEEHYYESNHCFAVNINHGCLFCFKCNDYIYNENFEDVLNEYQSEARRIDGNRSCIPWKPKKEEIALLKGKIRKISDDSLVGLRGIVNNGNTCYINVIIQVLIHNPVLRDFFLSDKHECFLTEPCLTCEMFVLFQEFYSGIKASLNLFKQFFPVLGKYRKKEITGEQDDCYIFFQEILAGLHSSCEENHQQDNCDCLIHRTFYGYIEKSKKCSNCEIISPLPLDQFMDIPLGLERDKDSLVEILNRKFLEPQFLPNNTCSYCGLKKVTAYFSETIKKLPLVICFRMYCVEMDKKKPKKKKTAFAFEEWIDMSLYLKQDENKFSNVQLESNSYTDDYRYQLSAVITHKGPDVEGGHYLVYVRMGRNIWYELNDHVVSKSNLEDVFSSEPYLLFYCKPL